MPKRRHDKARTIRPEAVAAFRAGDAAALRRALGLKPWEVNPLTVEADDANIAPGTCWAASVEKAIEIKRQLVDATKNR